MNNGSNNTRSSINILGIPIILTSIYYEFLFPFLVLIILCICSLEYVKLINRLNADLSLSLLLPFNLLIFLNAYFIFFNELEMLISFLILSFIYEILFHKTSSTQNVAFYLMGAILIGYCLSASLIQIRYIDNGFYYTLALFISVWVCDTFAFFFGCKLGKSKILPAISPNKTWVGCISGLVGSAIIFSLFYFLNNKFQLDINLDMMHIVVLSLITGIFGQIGDFAESAMKRQAHIKDTGSILMGHGGFLDRFDSITFAAPLYYIYITNFIK